MNFDSFNIWVLQLKFQQELLTFQHFLNLFLFGFRIGIKYFIIEVFALVTERYESIAGMKFILLLQPRKH